MSQGFGGGLFQSFLDYLYSSGGISIPSGFHARCGKVAELLDDDTTSVINTVLDYSINCASDTNYNIDSDNDTLKKLLNKWLAEININVNGIPTGLQQLSKEYFRERWAGSSLCLMRVSDWREITIGKTSAKVPMVLWFVNGSSVYVKRNTTGNVELGTDQYFLDDRMTIKLPIGKNENMVVQKPFGRWHEQYPSPYLVRKGIAKNALAIKTIQEKMDEIISKVLPYLFIMKKGTEEAARAGIAYQDEEFKKFADDFKDQIEKFKTEKGRVPFNAVPYDQEYNHLMPDLTNALKEELYNQGYRAILSGLGFINVIQGIGGTRKEEVINPKPFVAEVNSGVNGFKDIISEVILLIKEKNIKEHRKLFSDTNYIKVENSPLKINTEVLMEIIRSAYDRGVLSIQTYIETLGFNFEAEKSRRLSEKEQGLEDEFYPHLVNNQEGQNERGINPSKPRNDTTDKKENKKPNSPESKNFKNAEDETISAVEKEKLIEAPYNKISELPPAVKKMPEQAQRIWMEVWMSIYEETKSEQKAFSGAWSKSQAWLKKNNYKKVNNEWIKE